MAAPNSTREQHVEQTRQIAKWLEGSGVTTRDQGASVAVDMADMLYAAAEVRALLEQLLACDVTSEPGRSRAADLAAEIDVQLETELEHHLQSLRSHWSAIADAIGEHA